VAGTKRTLTDVSQNILLDLKKNFFLPLSTNNYFIDDV
jgi:hypothetical protein